MTALTWDDTGERLYETGVDRGVLYIPTSAGVYDAGFAWNGLTGVTESPSGAEATAIWADNTKYLNLISVEEFGGTIEAYTYPDEFMQCDGTAAPSAGVAVGQQSRKLFGLSYRTRLGNDVALTDFGYKLHLVYGALATPSEKAYATINDSPEAITFSWTFTTTPVAVPGFKPSALITIDSTKVAPADLTAIETALYGSGGLDPRLPLPSEILTLASTVATPVTTVAPTFTAATGAIVIPTVTGVRYRRADTGAVATGTITIATSGASLTITAEPASGSYTFTGASDDDWVFTRT